MEEKLTLEEKIDTFQKLIERKENIKAFINRCRHCEMEVKADYFVIPLRGEDKKLEEYIKEYYKKELEKVDEKLNELLK